MKKLMLFGLGVLASITVLTSCKKDEVVPEGPKITFTNGATYMAKVDDSLVTFIANIDAPAGIKSITVVHATNDSIIGNPITKFDSNNQDTVNCRVKVYGKTGEIKIKVSVVDQKDQTSIAIYTITKYGAVNSYSTTIMGAQYNNGVGSFFSTSNETVYSKTDAKTNASKVDFVYSYRGANMLAFLAAPSDTILDKTLNIKAESWGVYNSTKFKLSNISELDFDGINDDSKFIGDFTDTKVLNLQKGNVVYFKTQAGKLGLFKVKAINKGTKWSTAINEYQDGSIEIDVKVQK